MASSTFLVSLEGELKFKAWQHAKMQTETRPSSAALQQKIDNLIHALSLYFVFYNFVRTHGRRISQWPLASPTSGAIEARAPKPSKRGPVPGVNDNI